ncbi:hypothetical protein FOZ63_031809 [Perkinsus olseni]|uniref:RRM domain-containing protein n=1 Tax=Perkinsus olseni TaxID=32597 RepID=A0A7J6SVX4_PEROL|nr:hypothetical protein FOZ63_031809 [Perkinsus olseni]
MLNTAIETHNTFIEVRIPSELCDNRQTRRTSSCPPMKRFAYNKDHETDPALLRHKSLSVDGHHSANGLLGCCLPPNGPFAQYMLPNGLFAYYVPPSVSGYEANVAHVASSPFDQLPENVKPIVLDQHGIRIPFTCRSGDKTLSRRKSNKEARKHGRPDPRKVFIGGIHAGVSEDSMREAILNCIPRGTGVVDCSLVRDLRTGSNRGFGFVTFDSDKTAAFVLNKYYYSSLPCPLSIDGRAVSVKPYVVL